jgi:hypothetical protein
MANATLATAQVAPEPPKASGQSVTAAYEGWYQNPDGTYNFLVGYFNRNHEETLDIPIGPDNRIEPGGPDQGQPTHFLTHRQWGVFTITVPADFGNRELTWTLTVHGRTTEVPMRLAPLWEISPLREATLGNTPPAVWFSREGAPHQGPPRGITHTIEANVSEPMTLKIWTNDDGIIDPYRRDRPGPPVIITFSKFRGPGHVTFSKFRPPVREMDGSATTTVTFSEPGEYILRVQANDLTREGGGGTQCCWTNALVRVTVKP